MSLKIGSLCSGYEGLGMAVQAVFPDSRLAWVSDIDKGACKVLAHRFPHAPNIGDMTAVDWASVEPVDILTGGTPCQDLSHAGKRAGMTEGTRSNLWVMMREAIAQIRPRLVIWENVGGAYSAEADSELVSNARLLADTRRRDGEPVLRALGRVLGDLASLGYVGGWHGLRAADVGAPHGRLRVFVVAVAADAGDGPRLVQRARPEPGRGGAASADSDGRVHLASGARADLRAVPGADGRGSGPDRLLPSPRTSDTNGAGQHGDGGLDLRTAVSLLPTPAVNDMGAAYTPDEWDAWCEKQKVNHGNGNGHGKSLSIEAQRLLPTPTTMPTTGNGHARNLGGETRLLPTPSVADSTGGHESRSGARSNELLLKGIARYEQWGQYAVAIARWETINGPAPAPTETGPKGNPRLSPRFTEWMMGLPAGWITDVPDVTRNEALKLCGNGVVPQQAEAALRYLLPLIGEQVAA